MNMTIGSECPECGMIHPPLPDGQSCPNAKAKSGETSSANIDFTPLFAPLKNIVTSQIQQREIKDYQKMFGHIIVEMTRIIENYSE